jgi:hypothetical protein
MQCAVNPIQLFYLMKSKKLILIFLNISLQILEDGRLPDSQKRLVPFFDNTLSL